MDFSNAALIQEDVLANIILVVEAGRPAGPLFMHSLGAFVEASVIHDRLYFDPLRTTQRSDVTKGSLEALLAQSAFVHELIGAGLLEYFPARHEIDASLQERFAPYTTQEFVAGYQRGATTFTPSAPEQERLRYLVLTDVVDRAPQIFLNDSTTLDLSTAGAPTGDIDPSMQAYLLARLAVGLDDMEWTMLTEHNAKVRALVELTGHLGLNLYLSPLAFPHQIGAVRLGNRKARALYEKIVDEVVAVDADEVKLTAFSRVPIPPLAQMALQRRGDAPGSLVEQIVTLRDEHGIFRRSLTDIERSYNTASTRRQLDELNDLFNNSFATILAQTHGAKYHFLYSVFDILPGLVKGGPRGAAGVIGEKALERSRKRYIASRVRHTHDFYEALRDSPPARRNIHTLRKLFPMMDDDVWRLAEGLAASVERQLVKQPVT